MAFYSLFRRLSNCTTPIPLRMAIGYSAGNVVESNRISFLHLCTATSSTTVKKKKNKYKRNNHHRFQSVDQYCNSYVIRILNSEIKFALDSDLLHCAVDIPDGFPFTVQDNAGRRAIVLERKFRGETITVQVDMPTSSNTARHGDDDGTDTEPSVPLVITVSKGNGWFLQFDGRAVPGRILVERLSINKYGNSKDRLTYEGPDFLDLNGNFQKIIQDYLEIRGMSSSTANFVLEYMIGKDAKEYLRWLRCLKVLIE